MHTVVETHELAKTYGRFTALRGLSIAVPKGAVFALIGASGSGKTTAIKLLLNLTSPTHGSAALFGVDSRAVGPAVLARIGYVSENQALPPRLRVDEFFDCAGRVPNRIKGSHFPLMQGGQLAIC